MLINREQTGMDEELEGKLNVSCDPFHPVLERKTPIKGARG
jgi:hypothetical protein